MANDRQRPAPVVTYNVPTGEGADLQKEFGRLAWQLGQHYQDLEPNRLPRLARENPLIKAARAKKLQVLNPQDRAAIAKLEQKERNEQRARDLEIKWKRANEEALDRAIKKLGDDGKLKDFSDAQKKELFKSTSWDAASSQLKDKPEALKAFQDLRRRDLARLLGEHPEYALTMTARDLRAIREPEKSAAAASEATPSKVTPLSEKEIMLRAIELDPHAQPWDKDFARHQVMDGDALSSDFAPYIEQARKEDADRVAAAAAKKRETEWAENLLRRQGYTVSPEGIPNKPFDNSELRGHRLSPVEQSAIEALTRPAPRHASDVKALRQLLRNHQYDPTGPITTRDVVRAVSEAQRQDPVRTAEVLEQYPQLLDYLAAHSESGSHTILKDFLGSSPEIATKILATHDAPWTYDEDLVGPVLEQHRATYGLGERGFDYSPNVADPNEMPDQREYVPGQHAISHGAPLRFFPTHDEWRAGLTPAQISLERAAGYDPAATLEQNISQIPRDLMSSPEYRDYFDNPLWEKRVKDMRDESLKHLQERVLPSLNADYARAGTYNTTARQRAQKDALLEYTDKVDRAIREMQYNTHLEGLKGAERARQQSLERATALANAGLANRSGLLSLAQQEQAFRGQQKRDELGNAAVLAETGADIQNRRQQEATTAFQMAEQERNQPQNAAILTHSLIHNNPVGSAQSANPYVAPPLGPNPYAAMGGFGMTAADLMAPRNNYQQQQGPGYQQFAAGGRVRKAEGGPLSFDEGPLYQNPEMEQLRNAGRGEDRHPAWDLVRHIGIEMMKDAAEGKGGLEGVARGLEKGHQTIERKRDQNRQYGMWAAAQIQKSRENAHKIAMDYKQHSETVGETSRHNQILEALRDREVTEAGRHNLASEDLMRSQREMKIDPSSQKVLDRLDKNEPTLIELDRYVDAALEMLKKDPETGKRKIKTGTGISQVVKNPYVLSALGHGNMNDLDTYQKTMSRIASLMAKLELSGRQGAMAVAQEQAQKPDFATADEASEGILNRIKKGIREEMGHTYKVRTDWLDQGIPPIRSASRLGGGDAPYSQITHYASPSEEGPEIEEEVEVTAGHSDALPKGLNWDDLEGISSAELEKIGAGQKGPITINRRKKAA